MTIITEKNEYKILFNGSSTYMMIDSEGDCHGTYDSERKAINALNKTLRLSGKS